MVYSIAEKVMRCDNLDISDKYLLEEICTCLDDGWQVRVFSINKSDPDFVPKYTFIAEKCWQTGQGITLTDYQPQYANLIVDTR